MGSQCATKEAYTMYSQSTTKSKNLQLVRVRNIDVNAYLLHVGVSAVSLIGNAAALRRTSYKIAGLSRIR
jgi:hypothetical protein